LAVGNSAYTPYTPSGVRTTGSFSPTRPSTRDPASSFSSGRSDYTPSYPQPIDWHTETSRSYFGSSGPLYAHTSQLDSTSSQLQPSTYCLGTDHSSYDHTGTDDSLSLRTWPSRLHNYSISLEDIDPEVSSEMDSWVDRGTVSSTFRTELSNSIVSPFRLEHQLGLGGRYQERLSDDSSHSSSMRTGTASAQSNNGAFISDIASDVWGELRHSPANEANYEGISQQPVGRPVTMEDGSDDDIPTMATTMGQRSLDGSASDA
jgi:hypothetical protein